eukprot:13532732-Alexandrium_andersonii.AAC.1
MRLRHTRRPASSADSASARKSRRSHTSRASGTDSKAVSGPAQFQVRTPETTLRYSIRDID